MFLKYIFTLAENTDNKTELIKIEQKFDSFDSVINLGESFLGFPEAKMSLSWDELKTDTHLRTVLTQEVEDHLSVLESMRKSDISVSSYQFTYKAVEGLILDLKALHAAFRKKAAENGLLENEHFKADSRATVKWQLTIYNRLDKLRPSKMPISAVPDQASNSDQHGNLMHNTLYNLDLTLQKHNDEYDTNIKINRPHFKGGNKDSFLDFEKYQKDFKTFTRNIKDKVRLLQLLRDTTSGSARNQIEEIDLIAENFDVAWQRLE